MTANGVRLRRRGGRWVRQAVGETPPAAGSPAVPERLRGARRRGGRWVTRGSEVTGRWSVGSHVGRRLWLVAMPLVGMVAAHSYDVRPAIADIDAARVMGRTQLMNGKDDLRVQVDLMQNEIQALTAEIDTLHAPLITFHQAVHDSLLRMRASQVTPLSMDELDSLRALRDRLAGEVLAARAEYWNRTSVLGNLRAMQAALQDSIDAIARQALAMESADRPVRKRGLTLRSVVTYVGYAVAPVLGFMWAHNS